MSGLTLPFVAVFSVGCLAQFHTGISISFVVKGNVMTQEPG
jgi:hypothetical protein